MELQQVTTKADGHKEDDGAKEPMLGVKKTEEETQPDHYSKLRNPSEDVYTEANLGGSSVKGKAEKEQPDSEQQSPAEDVYAEAHFGKQTVGNVSLYRVGCLVLTVLCLVLLLAVIVLSMKVQTVCSEGGEADMQLSTCSYEQCQDRYGTGQGHVGGCSRCPPSWLTLEKSCYFLSRHRLSWEESKSYCAERGGTLAVINSQKLQIFLSEHGNLMYWIGLIHKGNKWSWVNNDSVQKSYWENNVSPAGCGVLNSRGPREKNWLSHNCDNYTYFICQLQI
ncbi:natural killer cells antigen CD94 isoform X2 [Solea solea]|uniref:natural killer cells antigen CD94 isoform X2 n=1 Tax=Solea solea TaxID=90069 RepID=UPI00272B90A8|nr:natural killer cells antigen CD94 isoform X2 [Solea solea]